jgi:membrane-associated phospholipid phosphatase
MSATPDMRPGAAREPPRRGPRITRDVAAVDRSIYRAIARTATPALDPAMKGLSRAADHSLLWLAIAGVLGAVPGRCRSAAKTGVASIVVASVTTNVLAKTLFSRRRPDRAAASVPLARQVRLPHSPSFPSGHAASAFAFATAVGREVPALALPLGLLATAVGYSRVHTGVHYPMDVMVGASVGIAAANATTFAQTMRSGA